MDRFQEIVGFFPQDHKALTGYQELLPIDLLDLWAGPIPSLPESPTYHLNIGHSSLEVTGLDDSHLHAKMGHLSPDRHTGRRARTSEDLQNKVQNTSKNSKTPIYDGGGEMSGEM